MDRAVSASALEPARVLCSLKIEQVLLAEFCMTELSSLSMYHRVKL